MSLPTLTSPDPLAIYSIGLKLRTLRTAKHLTLARLATQSGLSTALLSKLETDHMIPTLHTLDKICRIYGISLGHFFCEPRDRRGDHIPRPTPLHVPTPEARLLSQIIELPAGVSSAAGECGSITEVTAFVIEGTLRVSVAGSNETLEVGDSIVVTTDQPIVWSATEESPCRLLSVSAKPSPGQNPQ
jgi:transcriptional regulator with XRE-family HTH domain